MYEVHTTVASIHSSNYKQIWAHEHISNSQICDQEGVYLTKNIYSKSLISKNILLQYYMQVKLSSLNSDIYIGLYFVAEQQKCRIFKVQC
jgi:hypothetical protein